MRGGTISRPAIISPMSRPINIVNLSRGAATLTGVKYCDDFFSRLKGFTFRRELRDNEGLILAEKRDSKLDTSIHMLFVWTDLAVFWVNSNMVVVDKKIARSWHPYYVSQSPAQYVLELHPKQMDVFQIGDQLDFVNV
jgi:uncharacterized membrane protein (UPF0127 family)